MKKTVLLFAILLTTLSAQAAGVITVQVDSLLTDTAATIQPLPQNGANGNDRSVSFNMSAEDVGLNEVLIVFISLVTVFGTIFGIVFAIFYFRYKSRKVQMQVIEKALESGQPLPESFVPDAKKATLHTPWGRTSQGIAQMALGVGLTIGLWGVLGKVALFGLIVFFIGIGNFIIGFVEYKQHKKEGSNPSDK